MSARVFHVWPVPPLVTQAEAAAVVDAQGAWVAALPCSVRGCASEVEHVFLWRSETGHALRATCACAAHERRIRALVSS